MTRIVTILAALLVFSGYAWMFARMDAMESALAERDSKIVTLEAQLAFERNAREVWRKIDLSAAHEEKREARTAERIVRPAKVAQAAFPAPTKAVTVTAYTARPEETDDTPNITANNGRVRPGIVAVSRDLFKAGWVFGKKVYIEKMGVYTIDDLMAQTKTGTLDIFMLDHRQAQSFGKRKLRAFLVDT